MNKVGLVSAFVMTASLSIAYAKNEVQLREVSPEEITVMKNIAASGGVAISVRAGNKITDLKNNEHRFIIAGRGTYQLAAHQSAECSDDKKIKEAKLDNAYINSKSELLKDGSPIEVNDTAQEIHIPLSTYIRLENRGIVSSSEIFCTYELKSAGLAMAIDHSDMLGSMWTDTIPLRISDDTSTSEASINYVVETIGWHGAYPHCESKPCSISVSKNAKPYLLLTFVRRQ